MSGVQLIFAALGCLSLAWWAGPTVLPYVRQAVSKVKDLAPKQTSLPAVQGLTGDLQGTVVERVALWHRAYLVAKTEEQAAKYRAVFPTLLDDKPQEPAQ